MVPVIVDSFDSSLFSLLFSEALESASFLPSAFSAAVVSFSVAVVFSFTAAAVVSAVVEAAVVAAVVLWEEHAVASAMIPAMQVVRSNFFFIII